MQTDQSQHAEAARVIASGGIIAFRTDTFYGLGADPFNQYAVKAIRRLKGRDDEKPILVLISDVGQVERFIATRSELFDSVTRRYWPGPLTVIGVAHPELPTELTAGSGTIGVRLPDDKRVRDLVRACGGALTATSANPSGSLPARSAEEVQTYFPDAIDLIIDDGDVTVDQPSTVLDLSEARPRVVRAGALSLEELEEVLSKDLSRELQ
ncbi:MAG TPA: L-threonylcarbamoyladenylate synthase [Pyrinomonadaceae bacterium]|nr:L-threonylcarbamoyladenylate synthase [Pyrinomonadaceae bacterium]